jgi:hypothetical protein
MQEINKNFIKSSRERLKELSDAYYESSDEECDLKFNELKTYYRFLLENQTISNNNKVLYAQELIDCSRYYLKNWIVNFLNNAILKLYKKEINSLLLINNDYFLFKLLANKEIIKKIITRFDALNYFSLEYISLKILRLPESKTLFDDKNVLMEKINISIKKMNNFFENDIFQPRNSISLVSINNFFVLKNKLMEDKFVDLINNKYFFESVDNKIIVNDIFKDFLILFFNLEINDKALSLNSNDEKVIKDELEELLSFWS